MEGTQSNMASPDPQRRLLALVYQHLLQVGYKEAAQKLRKQSGEKLFTSQTVSLLDIYNEWSSSPGTATKRKAAKADQAPQTKKVRVCDPVSSSEVSEEEGKQQLTSNNASSNTKSVHANSTLKPVKIEKEKADKSKKKEKNAISVPSPAVQATAAELNRSKVSTPRKTTTVLKKAEASESSSEESSDEEDEQTIPETKQTPVSVTAADAKADDSSNSSGENSDSSDEKKASIVAQTKLPAKSAATIVTKSATVKNSTPLLDKVKSCSLATASKAESSDTSDSSESEDEEQPTSVPSSVKPVTKSAATIGTKTSSMNNGTPLSGKVKSSTPAPASKQESSESNDTSESEDEEPLPSSASAVKTASTTPASIKSVQGKGSTPISKPAALTKSETLAKAPGTSMQQKEESSSSSESSDGEDQEPPIKSAVEATPPATQQVKTTRLKSSMATPDSSKKPQAKATSLTPKILSAPRGKGKTPVEVAEIVTQHAASSDVSETSDSEDEEKTTSMKSPVKAMPPVTSIASSTSQKSHKDSPASKSIQGKAAILSTKPSPVKGSATEMAAVSVVQQSDSSDCSDSSESEDEEVATQTKSPVKATPPLKSFASSTFQKSRKDSPASIKSIQGKASVLSTKPAPVKGTATANGSVTVVQQSGSSDSSDSSESEDEEVATQTKPLAKATPTAKPDLLKGPAASIASSKGNVSTPASKAVASIPGKKVTLAKAAQQSESSGSSESSESDNEMQTEAKSVKVPPVKTTTPAKAASIVPRSEWQISGSESSDSSSSEDEKDTARKKPVPNGASVSLVKGTHSGILTHQIAKDKSSSEDSSEDSAADKMNLTQKDPVLKSSQPVVKTSKAHNPANPFKQGKAATPANPAQSKAVPSKTETPKAKPSKKAVSPRDESSDSSESEDEVMPAKTSEVKQAPTKKELPSSNAKKSGNKEINHSSSNSSDVTPISQELLAALSLKPKTTAAKTTVATPKMTSTINGKETKSTKPSVKVTAAEDLSESDTDAEAEKRSNQLHHKAAPSKEEVVPALSTQPTHKAKSKKSLTGEKAPSKRKAVEISGETPNVTSAKKAKRLSQNSQSNKGNMSVKSAEALLSLAEPDGASISIDSENETTTAAKAKSMVVASGDASSSEEETRKRLAAKATKAAKRKAKAMKKEGIKNKPKKLKKLAGDKIRMILPSEKSEKKKKKLDKKNKLKKKKKLSTKTPYLLCDSEQNAPIQENCSPFLQKKKKKKKSAKGE